MRKADKIKLLYIASVSLLAFIIGCVDTQVQVLPNSLDYRSQVSIVNLIPGGGTATINMYANKPSITTSSTGGDSIVSNDIDYSTPIINAQLALGGVNGYMDIPAGGKAFIATYSGFPAAKDTFGLTTDTDYKMRIYFVGDGTSSGIAVHKAAERYIGQKPGSSQGASIFPAGSGWIKLFNGSPDDTVTTIKIKGGSIDSTITPSSPVVFSVGTQYHQFTAGTYTLSFWNESDSLTSVTQNIASRGRYTALIYDLKASLKSKVLTDD